MVWSTGGLSPPLYIHSSVQGSLQGRLSEGSLESEWEQRVVQIFRSQVHPPTSALFCSSAILYDLPGSNGDVHALLALEQK